MSVEAMNWAYIQKTGSATRKTVLVALSNQADQDGRCWPSIPYIADRTELCRRSVIRAISELENMGFLERELRGGDGSGRVSNVYQMHLGQCAPESRQCAPESRQCAPDAPKQSITVKEQSKGAAKNAFVEFVKSHHADNEFQDWLGVLKKKKAATSENAWNRRLKKIQQLASDGHAPADVFAQSADSGWTGLFPLKPQNDLKLPWDNRALWDIRKAIGLKPTMHECDIKTCHAEINQHITKHPDHRKTVREMVGA